MEKLSEQRILGRTTRLTLHQRKTFDRIFASDRGYVLDFSDRTMSEWFRETFNIEIYNDRFQSEGTSKGKTLRGFVEVAEPRLVAKVLRALWDYRRTLSEYTEDDPEQEKILYTWLVQFTDELEQSSSICIEDAFKDFSGETTLTKLRASIASDLIDEKPDVALDRIHTYCVKRFRYLLAERHNPVDNGTPLPAIFGQYGKFLKEEGIVSEFALPTLRIQHKLFEHLNDARNKRSLAHDNPLLDMSEAKFVIDCILSSLSFIERIEEARNV
jgi:hypothetical protein